MRESLKWVTAYTQKTCQHIPRATLTELVWTSVIAAFLPITNNRNAMCILWMSMTSRDVVVVMKLGKTVALTTNAAKKMLNATSFLSSFNLYKRIAKELKQKHWMAKGKKCAKRKLYVVVFFSDSPDEEKPNETLKHKWVSFKEEKEARIEFIRIYIK